jgi:hypothetical protein
MNCIYDQLRWVYTPDTIVAMEKRYYCEIIAFLSRRYYRFYFVLTSELDKKKGCQMAITQRR